MSDVPAWSVKLTLGGVDFRKVNIRLPGKGDLNSHGARPVY
jgi:hypothetical protein